MNKSKILISLVGLSALVIPVVLLIVFTGGGVTEPEVSGGQRQIDRGNVQDVVDKVPAPPPIELPSPSPSSPSADVELEGSPAAQ